MVTQAMIKEALRYIGMPQNRKKSGQQEELDLNEEHLTRQVKEGFKLLEKIAPPRAVYQILDITKTEDTINLEGTLCKVQSKDLSKLMVNCNQCIIMAATLGLEVDRQIGLKQRVDMLEAVILDACASVLIDKVCDDIEAEIMQQLKEDEYFTMRFSPGYGDVPLEVSGDLLEILWAPKRIGLSLTHSQMLVPTKSITALIGISNQRENRQKSCGTCNLVRTCAYRKRGEQCGL